MTAVAIDCFVRKVNIVSRHVRPSTTQNKGEKLKKRGRYDPVGKSVSISPKCRLRQATIV